MDQKDYYQCRKSLRNLTVSREKRQPEEQGTTAAAVHLTVPRTWKTKNKTQVIHFIIMGKWGWGHEEIQQVKVKAIATSLNSVPETHMIEGES